MADGPWRAPWDRTYRPADEHRAAGRAYSEPIGNAREPCAIAEQGQVSSARADFYESGAPGRWRQRCQQKQPPIARTVPFGAAPPGAAVVSSAWPWLALAGLGAFHGIN